MHSGPKVFCAFFSFAGKVCWSGIHLYAVAEPGVTSCLSAMQQHSQLGREGVEGWEKQRSSQLFRPVVLRLTEELAENRDED